MKTYFLVGISLFSLFSCTKDGGSKIDSIPNSISYEYSFSTNPNPYSISFNSTNQTLYVANFHPSSDDYSVKIQVFNKEGYLLKTAIDFNSFKSGHFQRYEPLDFTFDQNQHLYILAKPLIKQPDSTWITSIGFCILHFNNSDHFINEFEFSDMDIEHMPASLSYHNNQLYITNGQILKVISLDTQQFYNIILPLNDHITGDLPFLHITDMEINTDGLVYFTGQVLISKDSVGCHLSSYNIASHELNVNYAKEWTWMCCAMLNNPGIFISNEGYLYLAGFYNMNIEVYDKNGDFIIDCDTRSPKFKETRPIDIVYCHDKIFVADSFNNMIHVFKQS